MTTATASSERSAAPPASYEAALAELEALVASMEGGQLPLESLLEGYRRGAELLQFCRSRLEAVELIHAYSLVHDDLPCMDNDVLRRGKPTVHVRYGVAQAMLAGDAMQALAFEMLTPDAEHVEPALQARLCALLARAAGADGMAG